MNIKQEKEFEIGGRKRLIKFGLNATAIYCDERDVSLNSFLQISFQNIKPGELRDIIWSGLVAGAKHQGNKVDFTKFDVGDWLDDVSEETMNDIIALIQGPQTEDGGGKKK